MNETLVQRLRTMADLHRLCSGSPLTIDMFEDAAKRIEELESALKPFADAVYNDNGDVTISTNVVKHQDWVNAYYARKKTAI